MSDRVRNEASLLQKEIDRVVSYLGELTPDSDEYNRVVDQLTSLSALLPNKEFAVKPDVLVSALSYLAGIVVIVGYEHAHVITSKALGFVPKIRI